MRKLIVCLFFIGCGSVTTPDKTDANLGHTLTVVPAGTGTGTVTSSPAGINCGTTCTAKLSGSVTLTAVADTNFSFGGWSGGGCSGTGTCTVDLAADVTVTATFGEPMQLLSVTKSGTGMGTVTSTPAGIDCGAMCMAMFPQGAMVMLTPTPSFGHALTNWAGGCTGTGACSVTMSAPQTVNAEFTPATLYLIDDGGDSLYKVTNLGAPTLTLVGALGVAYEFGDCAYDSTNGILYFVDGRPATPTNSLYKVNTNTGAATLIGAHGVSDMFALGYDPQNDTLYGVGNPAYTLYTLNKATGAATIVGTTSYTNGLVWDTKRNHMVAITSSGSFNTINLATGAQTPIAGAGPVLGNNNGIAYDIGDDLFWMSSYTPGMAKFDPNANFAETTITVTGMHTCITYVP